MTAGLIFDYGGTLDTGGQHWGQALWHAYERHHVPVTEAQFREAYVHAERMLGRNPIIRPDFTFRQTLEKKLQLQLEFLELENEEYRETILEDLYGRTVEQTSKSRKVLQALKDRGLPLVLVSNFYGNMSVVLREFGFDGLFLQVYSWLLCNGTQVFLSGTSGFVASSYFWGKINNGTAYNASL